jgi:hypothetical protein
MPEIGRHHSDNGVAIFVHSNSSAHDVGIAAELALPEPIADYHCFAKAGHRILGPVHSPEGGIPSAGNSALAVWW